MWGPFACLAVASLARDARADRAGSCESASEQGQSLRNDHKLVEARQQFALCSRSVCEKDVRTDCAQWLGEVDAQLPSIVLAVTDEQGADVKGAKLAIDGKVVDMPTGGAPVPLDPGEHKLVIGADGYNAEHRTFVARVSEHGTRVPIVLTRTSTAAPEPADAASTVRPIPTASLIAFGVAGAGLVVGTVFTVLAVNAKSDPGCPNVNSCPSGFDVAGHNATVSGDSVAAGVGFGVALVGAGLGAWFLLHDTAPAKAQPGSTDALRIEPRIGLGWAGIGGTFQ